MRTPCYLINLSPSAPWEGDVPERVWTGKDVSYSHLRVSRCKAFVDVPKEQRTKIDDKAIPCIFLCYDSDKFEYRLWDPKNKKVIRSRDVVFCDDKFFADFGKDKEPQNVDIIPDPIPKLLILMFKMCK